jgi:hypothetical protein
MNARNRMHSRVNRRRRRALLAAIAATLLVLLPSSAAAALPPISVSGNHFVAGGQTVRLLGVNRSGSEYACAQSSGFFQGPVDDATIDAMLTWKINAVALPLNEACWLGGFGGVEPAHSDANYRNAITDYVDRLNAKGIYVVLRLSGAAPGDHAFTGLGDSIELPMADADHAPAFWTSVATAFKDNHDVVFHTYDEPNGDDVTWDCLFAGCSASDARFGGAYQTAAQPALVAAIRATGATQPIILSGPYYAGTLDQWLSHLPDDGQLVADLSAFDYNAVFPQEAPNIEAVAQTHPVIFGGFGDTDCNSDYSRALMDYSDAHGVSYLAWTWNTAQDYGGCSNALLDDDGPLIDGDVPGYRSGLPSGFGLGIRDHLIALAAAAATAPPATTTTPTVTANPAITIVPVKPAATTAPRPRTRIPAFTFVVRRSSRRGSVSASVRNTTAGATLTARLIAKPVSGARTARPRVLATTRKTHLKLGTVRFRLTLSAKDRRALRRLHRLAATLTVTLAASNHTPRTETRHGTVTG